MLTPFLFASRLCDGRNNQSRYQCRCDSGRTCTERPCQYSEPPLLAYRLFSSPCKGVTESGQRNGGTAACEINKRLIKPQCFKCNAQHNKGYKYPCRGYIGSVNKSLTDYANQAAY